MQLQSTRKGALSIADYYSRMKIIVDNLITAGILITNEELTLYLLGGLGSEYDLVVVNVTARNILPTLEETFSLLLTHESRVEQANSTMSIDILAAHYTSGPPPRNWTYNNAGRQPTSSG